MIEARPPPLPGGLMGEPGHGELFFRSFHAQEARAPENPSLEPTTAFSSFQRRILWALKDGAKNSRAEAWPALQVIGSL